jgi:hypothetical protein
MLLKCRVIISVYKKKSRNSEEIWQIEQLNAKKDVALKFH